MKLDDLIRQLETSLASTASVSIASDIKDIKKEYRDRPHQLQADLEDFVRAIDEPLKRVSVQTRVILAMQVARRGVVWEGARGTTEWGHGLFGRTLGAVVRSTRRRALGCVVRRKMRRSRCQCEFRRIRAKRGLMKFVDGLINFRLLIFAKMEFFSKHSSNIGEFKG